MSFFVDLKTGEVFEADAVAPGETHLYEEVPGYEFMSPPEFALPEVEIVDRSWVVEWYLRRKAELEGRIAARKAAHAIGLREDQSALRCLDWRYFDEVLSLAKVMLAEQGGTKKSVNTPFGKVGWRKDTKVHIDKDREEELVVWLLERDEEHPAVKLTPSILKKQLPAGEEIPGVTWPSGDVFFANPAKAT